MNCLLDDGIKRPSMNEVAYGLELALQMQHSANDINSTVHGEMKGPSFKSREKVTAMTCLLVVVKAYRVKQRSEHDKQWEEKF